MKWGFRKPSLKKRIAARTSVKRYARHSLGLKAPRGWGWFTNPKKALYNRVYNRTTFSLGDLFRSGKKRSRSAPVATTDPSKKTSAGCLSATLGCGGVLVLLFVCCGIAGVILPGNPSSKSGRKQPAIDQAITFTPIPAIVEESKIEMDILEPSIDEPNKVDLKPSFEVLETRGNPKPEVVTPKLVIDPDMRIWTSSDGKNTVEAKFESSAFGTVYLRNPAGKKIAVQLDELTTEDQKLIRERARQ